MAPLSSGSLPTEMILGLLPAPVDGKRIQSEIVTVQIFDSCHICYDVYIHMTCEYVSDVVQQCTEKLLLSVIQYLLKFTLV